MQTSNRSLKRSLKSTFIGTLKKLFWQPWEVKMVKYAGVGLISTTIDFGITVLLVEVFSLNPILASVFGFCGGVANGYILNSKFTFAKELKGSNERKSYRLNKKDFSVFLIVSIIGLFINTGLVSLFIYQGFWYIYAKIGATLLSFFWNFSANDLYTFRAKNKV